MYSNINKVILRPYQEEAIQRLRQAYNDGYKAPVYVLPCGGGKTIIFCWIAQSATAKGNKVLVLVHRQELIRQTCDTLNELGVAHGVIAAGRTQTHEPIQVASIQTLVRRLERFPDSIYPDLIIIDESHHLRAGSWIKTIKHFNKARLLCVTASPCRLDGLGLGVQCGGFNDVLIQGPNIQELTQQGYLSPVTTYAPPVGVDLGGVHKKYGDYDKTELIIRMDKPKIIGNVVEHYKRICPDVPAIAFCISVKAAERVAQRFNEVGIPAATIDGTLPDPTRKNRIKALGDGSLQVLTSCEIVSEGFDLPVVGCGILLRPTMSLSVFIQQTGRPLRPYPGKKEAIILDHVNNCSRHGMPDDIREWTLDGAKAPVSKGESEPLRQVRTCQKCFAVYKATFNKCPQCGTPYRLTPQEIKEVEGQLEKVEERRQWIEKRREQGTAHDLDALIAVGKKRRYKNPYYWAKCVLATRAKKKAVQLW